MKEYEEFEEIEKDIKDFVKRQKESYDVGKELGHEIIELITEKPRADYMAVFKALSAVKTSFAMQFFTSQDFSFEREGMPEKEVIRGLLEVIEQIDSYSYETIKEGLKEFKGIDLDED